MSAKAASDLAPAGQRAITRPVGQRPLPGLPLKRSADTIKADCACLAFARTTLVGPRMPYARIAHLLPR